MYIYIHIYVYTGCCRNLPSPCLGIDHIIYLWPTYITGAPCMNNNVASLSWYKPYEPGYWAQFSELPLITT